MIQADIQFTTAPSAYIRSSASGRARNVLIVIVALFAAFVIGVGTAFAGVWMALLGVGAFSALFSFALPLHWLVAFDLLLATVVAGSVEYFLGLSQAHWIPYLLGLLLVVRSVIDRGAQAAQLAERPVRNRPVWFKGLAGFYIVVLIGTSTINLSPGLQVLAGLKNFVFMWGVLLAMLAMRDWETVARNLWRVIAVICCLQLPVTVYQRVFIASKSNSYAPWDSVVGTFGGTPLHGGHSASMALFICAALVLVLVGWRDGVVSRSRVVTYLALAIPSVLLAEVKAVVIWLVLGVGLIFIRLAKSRPRLFIGGLLLNATLVVALVSVYVTFHYSEGGHQTLGDIYDKQVAYAFDVHKFNPVTRELGRAASIVFWAQEQRLSEPASLLIGNGIGSSRGLSTFGTGVVAKRYSYFIDTSGLAVLLWDVGLLGTLAFAGMLLLGAIQGIRLGSDQTLTPQSRRIAEVSGITLLLILSGLPYTRDAVDDSSVQFLLFFCLACVARAAAAGRPGSAGADVPA